MRAAIALLLAALPAVAQTLPKGRCRATLTHVYVHQALPSIDVPHLIDQDTAVSILSSFDKGTPGALDLRPVDLHLFSPGIVFSGRVELLVAVPQLDCGLTDRLTASVVWPWFELARTRARLSASSSVLGYNIEYDPQKPFSIDNSPVTIRSGRLTTGTEAVQQLLANFFGYRRIGDHRDYGTGDPALALSWAAVDRPDLGVTATAIGFLPLGRIADPDNLLSIPLGEGHARLGGRLFVEDRGAGKYVVQATLGYLFHFPDHPTLRVYRLAAVPLARADSKERVFRRAGQQFSGALGLVRPLFDGVFRPSLSLGYEHVQADTIRGSEAATHYEALVSNTGKNLFSAEVGLQITTVDPFLAGRFPLPAQLSLNGKVLVADRGLFDGIPQLQLALAIATFF